MPHSRITAAVSIVAGVTVLLVAPSAAASPALTWKDCAKDVQCATLAVPLDWRRGGETIGISLARRAATGTKIGTIVYLPGGPGDSGVQQLKGGPRVSPEVAERFDVISLDPRGVNESSPVKCDPALISGIPDVNPDTGAKFADVMAYSRKLADSCQARTGGTINHIDSADVARDVDALRTALGERQISVYSRSYGTLAAQMYAELFPKRVRSMVLDSVFDHSLDTGQFNATLVRTVEDSFNQFATWCATSENCVLRGQDVSALFDGLYRRAERGELTEPGDPSRRISTTDLSWITMRRFFYVPAWKELSIRLAELTGQRPPSAVAPMPQTEFFPSAVLCADHRFRFSAEQEWTRMWAELKRMAPVMRTHLAWQAASFCAGWPLPATNPQHQPRINAPVLILNSRHDPATPMEWAANVHRMIRGSAMVTYEGSGHGVFLRTDCTKAVTNRYFLDRVLPAPGTSCPGSDPA